MIESLTFAAAGIAYALRTQRNMRIHVGIGLLALILAGSLGVSRAEMGLLILTIAVVLAAEMLNTAVEAAVDLVTQEYSPLAETAKNVAAGAVLIAAIGSSLVGYVVFFHRLSRLSESGIRPVASGIEPAVLIALAAVTLTVVAIKARGTPFRVQGGFPSIHSAVAFSLATLVFLLGSGGTVKLLGIAIAALVGQARLEAGIHSFFEVVAGALVGVAVTLFVFQIVMAA